jgi:hypothetical protein
MMSGIRPPLPAAALARNREYVFHAHELVGEASGNRGVTRTVLWMRSMEEGGLSIVRPFGPLSGAPVSIVVAAQISTRVASVVGRSGILDHLPQHLTPCYRVTLLKSLERSFCCDRDNHISRAVDGVDLSQVPFCGMWLSLCARGRSRLFLFFPHYSAFDLPAMSLLCKYDRRSTLKKPDRLFIWVDHGSLRKSNCFIQCKQETASSIPIGAVSLSSSCLEASLSERAPRLEIAVFCETKKHTSKVFC